MPSGATALGLLLLLLLLASGCRGAGVGPGDLSPDLGPTDGGVVRVPLYPIATESAIPDQLLVAVTIEGNEGVLMRLDTASPNTTLPASSFDALGLTSGAHDVWIGDRSTGLHVGTKQLGVLEAIGYGPIAAANLPPGSVLRGTAGNDLWAGYAIGLDLVGGALYLVPHGSADPALDATQMPHPTGSGPPIVVEAEHVFMSGADEGGALFTSASFDASGASGTFLIDTGTNTNLALGPYWQRVMPASSRSIPFDSEDAQGSPLPGAFQLGSGYTIGGQVLAATEPVWVLAQFPILTYEGQVFHRPLDGLLGLWGLLSYYVVLDFGGAAGSGSRIFLFPSTPVAGSLDEDFTGYGLVPALTGSAVRVAAGSDAQAKGVQDGDELVGASGGPLTYLPTGILGGALGEMRTFMMKRGATSFSVDLVAEKVLGP